MKKTSILKSDNILNLLVLLVVFLVVFLIISSIRPATFFTIDNLQSMAFQMPELGILSLAMFLPMITGGINLSIITSANFCSILGTLFLVKFYNEPMGIFVVILSIIIILILSIIIGFLNGILIGFIGISPILATLSTMLLTGGLSIGITKGGAIYGFPNEFLYLGRGSIGGIPVSFIIFIFLAIITALILNKKALGFNMYMFGSEQIVSLFSGVNNVSIIIKTYILSGLFSGIAAIIMAARYNSAKPGYGAAYLLITILIPLLGGTSAAGGEGTVIGIVLATLILQILRSGFNIIGVSAYLTTTFWGLILIIVMFIYFIKDKIIGKSQTL